MGASCSEADCAVAPPPWLMRSGTRYAHGPLLRRSALAEAAVGIELIWFVTRPIESTIASCILLAGYDVLL